MELAQALSALKSERRGFAGRVKQAEKDLRAVRKQHEHGIRAAERELAQARQPAFIGHAGKIRVFEDHVETPEGRHPLDEQVQASVQTAGNMTVTQRVTLTRVVGLGVVGGLVLPKKTKHDDRDLYFAIEHPQWASMAQLNPDVGAAARQVVRNTNLAARNVAANSKRRQQLITSATEQVRRARQDTDAVDHAQRALAAANASATKVDLVAAAVRERLAGVPADSRLRGRAEKALAEQPSGRSPQPVAG